VGEDDVGDVTLHIEGHVAVVTIDAPEVRNGLTPEMGRTLASHCAAIDGDPDVGAAVVKGAGGTFCSGADRRGWTLGEDQASDRTYKDNSALYSAFMSVGDLKVPTVAAVRGAAVGAGMNLVLATDLRIVSTTARLLSGVLRIGLHPGGGYFTISGRLAGREATAAMGLFHEEIDGVRAVELGMAWEALPDEEVEDRAMELATGAAKDPELAREALRSFRTELGPPAISWPAALDFERGIQMWSQRRRADST
jgi:enoyl-CoA hydratase